MTGRRAQQSLCQSIWVNIVEFWLCLCILAKLVGLILLILTSIVWLPALALCFLSLSILSAIPFLFVVHAVPRLNDFFRHIAERDVNKGSLAQVPPEILQKIFDHCCDQEYVDFFHHFSLGPTEERRCNTVYTLKSVCKEWKLLAETTPTLWQKIQFGTFDDTRVQEPDHKGEDVFRSLRHCTDMMEQVLLPRSGQLPIQIRVTRRCGAFHMLHPGSLCNHVGYTLPLLKLISPQSHRFTSIALDGWGREKGEVVENLIYILSSIDFRHLEVLSLDGGVPWGRYPSSQPPFNLFQHAPKLAKLVLTGSEPRMQGRGGITENLIIRWSKITTLELNLSRYYHDGPAVSVSEVARVLQAVCHNLIHLSWMGDWHCHGDYFEERRVAAAISKLPEIFGGPQLVLSDLHSLTLADKDNEFQFSTIFLPKIMCPKLEELRVLLCTEDQSYGYKLREKSVARPPINGLRQLLYESPNLRQVTILQAGINGFREKLEDDRIGEGMNWFTTFGYLVLQGNREYLQSLVADQLSRDAGVSSQLSLLSLSQHSPEFTKLLLRRIMALVPWYTYTTDDERQRQDFGGLVRERNRLNNRHPIRPVAKTTREMFQGADQGLLFQKTFTFVQDIARTADHDSKYGHLPTVDQVIWGDMSSKDLSILTSILDLIRYREPSASPMYGFDSLPDTCIFTIAVPRGRFRYA